MKASRTQRHVIVLRTCIFVTAFVFAFTLLQFAFPLTANRKYVWAQTVSGGVLRPEDRPQLFILMSDGHEYFRSSTGAATGKTWTCLWYEVIGFQNDFDITPTIDYSKPAKVEHGKRYMFSCYSEGRIVFQRYTVYNVLQPSSVIPIAFSQLELFLQDLHFPTPTIFRNPPADTLPGIRLYLWTDVAGTRRQTLSSSWGSVTAEIRVAKMVWRLWDGSQTECFANEPLTWRNDGSLYIPARNCSLVPQESTSSFTNQLGQIRVSVTYATTWRAELLGQVTSGTLPTVTREASAPIRIRSLQAVVKTYR